ncbi:Hypothetical_protein [Hexamita inflata]|uniref:Hypothetical_protein n=1 Tax=Hexamita inflata TaxID=28002 RepID=A0AA86Q951_9EUKA|nr:Hypothetical protein HINF_LOCUS41262 [Hexamita inflata]CAI9953618.1 Hypothetical protein HINF_LOCUS41263 [Hexamita inflata]
MQTVLDSLNIVIYFITFLSKYLITQNRKRLSIVLELTLCELQLDIAIKPIIQYQNIYLWVQKIRARGWITVSLTEQLLYEPALQGAVIVWINNIQIERFKLQAKQLKKLVNHQLQEGSGVRYTLQVQMSSFDSSMHSIQFRNCIYAIMLHLIPQKLWSLINSNSFVFAVLSLQMNYYWYFENIFGNRKDNSFICTCI